MQDILLAVLLWKCAAAAVHWKCISHYWPQLHVALVYVSVNVIHKKKSYILILEWCDLLLIQKSKTCRGIKTLRNNKHLALKQKKPTFSTYAFQQWSSQHGKLKCVTHRFMLSPPSGSCQTKLFGMGQQDSDALQNAMEWWGGKPETGCAFLCTQYFHIHPYKLLDYLHV